MPSFKNQHFVPQCYLRSFSLQKDTKARSISLFNLRSHRLFENAPIKNQCSKDYFYGKDLKIEKALHEYEGSYSNLLQTIQQNPTYQLTEKDKKCLINFWFVQYIRTEYYIKESLLSFQKFVENNEIQEHIDNNILNQYETTKMIMKNMHIGFHLLDDLTCILIKNYTEVPFITSDNPAILTNRYYFKKDLLKYFSFGLNSMGTLLILPISPNYCFLAYDKKVYSIPHHKNILKIKKDKDIEIINQFQIINCNYNIYLSSTSSFESYYKKYLKLRSQSRYKLTYSILDESTYKYKKFKLIPSSELKNYKYSETLTHISTNHPEPDVWPSFLQWNTLGYGFSSNSGQGHVREKFKEILDPKHIYKVKI
ncbi:DUF4238 domain-containing protein [Acinetobacter pittii]|uniref:DUF4238 domain-containing protein n=1 Tax=Acinetobacter pittii TaxID=48296 RepID=UPI001C221341|nr:DUF4238 domain-containing protein [Acinetobacter pittii]QXA06294.1 DUF4238 domain-containing protein [Acinetobacter pittii]